METLVLFVFIYVSQLLDHGVSGGKTLAECEASRAVVMEKIEEIAPTIGDRVYVGPCQRIELKHVNGPKNGASLLGDDIGGKHGA